MKKGKLIGKIFGIGLVLVMITGVLGALPALRARAEASSASIYVSDNYRTIQATVDATSLDFSPAANLPPANADADAGTPIASGVLGGSFARQLARTSDGAWHSVYYRSDGTYTQIYCSKSTDGGETWTEEQITTAPLYHYQPSVAIDSDDNVHIAWIVFPDGDPIDQSYGYLWPGYPGYPGRVSTVQYRTKTSVWQGIEDVKTGYHTVLSIAVDSENNVHLAIGGHNPGAWNCAGISYAKRTASGWGPIERVSSGCWTGVAAIAMDDNNNAHVVYGHSPYGDGRYEIVYRQRTSSGWASEIQLQSFDNWSSGGVSIGVDNNNHIHVVWGWREREGNNYGIRYRRFTTFWQPIEILEGPTLYTQYNPAVATDSNDHIHVVWSGQHTDSPASYQLRYREYTSAWQPIENLTSSSSHNQTNPSLMWAFYPVIGGIKTNQPEDGFAFVWMDGTTVRYWSAEPAPPPDHTPLARASDISGQPQVMFPDTRYTVKAKYFDPDGRDDLKYCYLRLEHPDKPLTMMWNEATDDFWVYAGEEGENYLTLSGDSTPITEGGLEGYELAWSFTINDQWPEVENAIDFGVYAWDDGDLTSGWDYDSTKASFSLTKPDDILTKHLKNLVAGSLYRIEELGDVIVGTDGLVAISNYFEAAVARKALEAFLSAWGDAFGKLWTAAYGRLLVELPVLEKMLVVALVKEGKSEDITKTIEGHIAEANSEINAKLQGILDNGYSADPELVEAYIRDLGLRRAAHSSLELIASAQREALADAAEAIKMREPMDMTLRAIWSTAKILIGYFYPPALPLLLLDTTLRTLTAAEELGERGTLWASSLLAASSVQISMWEIWRNTLDGLELIADGETPVIPECELEWLSDHLIDHDAAIRGLIRVPGGFGVEAYSLLRLRNTGQHDAEYKIVARFVGAPWSDMYTISMEKSIKAGSDALIRLDYTESERFQVYLEGGIPPIQTLTRYRGTPPEDLDIVDYHVFARTETGLYGLRDWFRIFSPTTEPGWTATATIRMELAHLGSPAELRVRDSMDRISGIIDGEVKQGIPNAAAFDDNTIFIFDSSAHVYEVKGMDAGTYRLEIVAIQHGESAGIGAIDIPITTGAMHQYVIDWDALSKGEEGVTVQVDSDGDGEFEDTFTSDEELTEDEFLKETRPSPPVGGKAYPINKIGILAFWIALLAAIVAGAAMVMRRHRAQS